MELRGTLSPIRFESESCAIAGISGDFGVMQPEFSAVQTEWRRERDSNPRYPLRYSGFQDRLIKPLSHPSAGTWDQFSIVYNNVRLSLPGMHVRPLR